MQRISRVLSKPVDAVNKFSAGISAQAVPQAVNAIGKGFVGVSPSISKASMLASNGLTLTGMLLNEFAKRSPRTEKAKKVFDAVNAGANTTLMGTQFLIALYIEYLGIAKHFNGKTPVDRNDDFLAFFLVPAFVLGTLHTSLELTKNKWSEANNKKAKVTMATYLLVMSFYFASNINAFLILASGNKFKEQGDVNPTERTVLFVVALLLGAGLAGFNFAKKTMEPYVHHMINALCATSYLASFLTTSAREELGEELSIVNMAAIGTFALLATVLAYVPEKKPLAEMNERSPLLRNSLMANPVTNEAVKIEEIISDAAVVSTISNSIN